MLDGQRHEIKRALRSFRDQVPEHRVLLPSDLDIPRDRRKGGIGAGHVVSRFPAAIGWYAHPVKDGGAKARQEKGGGPTTVSTDTARTAQTRIQELAKRLGNDEITKRIEAGNATRDELLAFVMAQLKSVRGAQQQEVDLSKKQASFPWWGLSGIKPPDPTRWQDTAKAYQAAVDAICRGDLRKGQKLVEEAVEQQQKTLDRMTELVDRSQMEASADPSELARIVAMAPTAGACAEPQPITDLLATIQNTETRPPGGPDDWRILRWWEETEDEEKEQDEDEEDEVDGAGGGGAS